MNSQGLAHRDPPANALSHLSMYPTAYPLSTAAVTPPGWSSQKPLAQDDLYTQELEKEKDRHDPAWQVCGGCPPRGGALLSLVGLEITSLNP